MKRLVIFFALLPALCFGIDNKTKAELMNLFKKRFPGRTVELKEFNIKPYWVVEVDGRVFLVDPENKIVFPAAFDISGKDILKKYKEELVKKSISNIDLSAFVHYTKKPKENAKKVLLFTDPKCPFCKKTFRFLRKYADNGTIDLYLAFIPIHRNVKEVEGILCSKDPAMTYADIVDGRKVNLKGCSKGSAGFFKHLIWARRLGFGTIWKGVPTTFIIEKKTYVVGAKIKELEKLLEIGKN